MPCRTSHSTLYEKLLKNPYERDRAGNFIVPHDIIEKIKRWRNEN